MPETVLLQSQARAAAIVPQSVNPDSRTVEVTFTTGALVRRYDWMEGEYEEELVVTPEAMRMDRLNSGAPLLADHACYDLDRVHGVVERAWIKDGKGYAQVRFAKDEATETIWQKVRDGIIRNISVGYNVYGYQEIKDGLRRILRAIDWEPMEISLVAVGADAGATVRNAETARTCTVHRAAVTHKRGTEMTTENEQDPAPAADVPETPAAPAAEPAPAADAPAAPAEAAPVANEERALEIMDLCQLGGVSLARAAEFVRGGKPIAEVRAALLAERAAKSGEEIQTMNKPPVTQKAGGTAERMAARFSSAKTKQGV